MVALRVNREVGERDLGMGRVGALDNLRRLEVGHGDGVRHGEFSTWSSGCLSYVDGAL